MLRLTEEYLSDEQSFNLSEKGSAVVDLLENCGAAAVKEVMYFCGVSESVISTLKKNGVVEKFENEYISETYTEITEDDRNIALSEEQQNVFDGISALMELGEPQAALLYGVTGSGKTAVFISLNRISEVLFQLCTAVCRLRKGLTNLNASNRVNPALSSEQEVLSSLRLKI